MKIKILRMMPLYFSAVKTLFFEEEGCADVMPKCYAHLSMRHTFNT